MEFALDIETIPNKNMVEALPEPEYKYGNTKDPDKRKVIEDETKQKQIDNMALSPFYGRICSYAVYGPHIKKYHTVDEISDAAEIELINEIFDLLTVTTTEVPRVITWRGNDFDLPFIFIRAAIMNVFIPAGCLRLQQMVKRYITAPHCDLERVISNWGQKMVSLNFVASSFIGEKKIEMDVTKFVEMIETGKSHDIGIYNLKDAELTYRCFDKLQPYLF